MATNRRAKEHIHIHMHSVTIWDRLGKIIFYQWYHGTTENATEFARKRIKELDGRNFQID